VNSVLLVASCNKQHLKQQIHINQYMDYFGELPDSSHQQQQSVVVVIIVVVVVVHVIVVVVVIVAVVW
jgi:CHASE3 domain sensor protein